MHALLVENLTESRQSGEISAASSAHFTYLCTSFVESSPTENG